MTKLVITTGTSRGRDTEGYTIVRLRDLDTGKLYRCMGGGYDMVGTVLADWLADVYADRVATLADRAYYRWSTDTGLQVHEGGMYGLYGVSTGPSGVRLDGACGQSLVLRIAEAVGITITGDRFGGFHAEDTLL